MPRKPWWSNLRKRISWSTVSKAFFRSMKIPHENKRLFIFVCIAFTISRIACRVECALRKPHWDGVNIRGKLKRPLTSSSVNHWEIALYSSFFKLVKDIRKKSMENNGDEIAVLFPEGHEAIHISYLPWGVSFKWQVTIYVWIISCLKCGIMTLWFH